MVLRKDLKDAHENSVLSTFKDYMKEKGSILKVENRPDPPDALVEIDNNKTWIEITDAFFSDDVAKSITSYAAHDKIHQPSKSGLFIDADAITSERVESVIKKKLTKSTMIELANLLGGGILLVGLFDPFFDINVIENHFSIAFEIQMQEQKVFGSIYLYETCSEKVHKYKKIK